MHEGDEVPSCDLRPYPIARLVKPVADDEQGRGRHTQLHCDGEDGHRFHLYGQDSVTPVANDLSHRRPVGCIGRPTCRCSERDTGDSECGPESLRPRGSRMCIQSRRLVVLRRAFVPDSPVQRTISPTSGSGGKEPAVPAATNRRTP